MLALPFLVINQNCMAFLQCQRVMRPQMFVGIVMNPIAIGLFWLTITKLEMGTSGTGSNCRCCQSMQRRHAPCLALPSPIKTPAEVKSGCSRATAIGNG